MQTKLTLRLEDHLIAQAKDYAQASGKSLSQLVAEYFARLEKPAPALRPLPPLTARLKGALAVNPSGDEQDYRDYLEDKYR
jgi:hypothetical protein